MSIDSEWIEERWPLSGVSIVERSSWSPFRRILIVRSEQGEFVGKVDSSPSRSHATERLSVLTCLAAQGFLHAPRLLGTSSGERFASDGEASVWLLELVPRPLVDGEGDVAAWEQLGRIAGELNGISGCGGRYLIPTDAALAELRERAEGWPFEAAYVGLLDRLEALTGVGESGLIHGELHVGNVGRRADGTVVLLDWDQAGVGPTVIEYGYPLIINFVDVRTLAFDRASASAFYAGYQSADGVVDRSHAFLAGLFHAMRYMFPPLSAYPRHQYGEEVERRWTRVCFAVEHESELCAAIP